MRVTKRGTRVKDSSRGRVVRSEITTDERRRLDPDQDEKCMMQRQRGRKEQNGWIVMLMPNLSRLILSCILCTLFALRLIALLGSRVLAGMEGLVG